MKRIKVIVVDDAASMRETLASMLSTDPQIDVVCTAADPYDAREKIKQYNPDVLTLDVEMPKMNGIKFLENLMRLRPMPVIMVSSIKEAGTKTVMRALELGAIDFIDKPKLGPIDHDLAYVSKLIERVKEAAHVPPNVLTNSGTPGKKTSQESLSEFQQQPPSSALKKFAYPIVAIGASTGGSEALEAVLTALPEKMPAIVITIHIPGTFSRALAKHLDGCTPFRVQEAEDGMQLRQGHVYIAPGGHHLVVAQFGQDYYCGLEEGPLVNLHRPAVDVLFNSLAVKCARQTLGVILTGMGKDGAEGLLSLHNNGACTIAQDEKTSVVFGMPKAAIDLGAVDHVLPLHQIPASMVQLVNDGVYAPALL